MPLACTRCWVGAPARGSGSSIGSRLGIDGRASRILYFVSTASSAVNVSVVAVCNPIPYPYAIHVDQFIRRKIKVTRTVTSHQSRVGIHQHITHQTSEVDSRRSSAARSPVYSMRLSRGPSPIGYSRVGTGRRACGLTDKIRICEIEKQAASRLRGWLCEYMGHFRYKWLNYARLCAHVEERRLGPP